MEWIKALLFPFQYKTETPVTNPPVDPKIKTSVQNYLNDGLKILRELRCEDSMVTTRGQIPKFIAENNHIWWICRRKSHILDEYALRYPV